MPLPSNAKKIKDFAMPTDKPALHRFFGLCNFCRLFIPSMASVIKPLTDLTSLKISFLWTLECDMAFLRTKNALDSIQCLAFPQEDVQTHLSHNTSNIWVGAVLKQQQQSCLASS